MSVDSLPWFRFYNEFMDDPKVQSLTFTQQRHFIMLMCARSRNGSETLQDRYAMFHLRISEQEWAETKKALLDAKLIDSKNHPTNWDKRQKSSDFSNQRVTKHRDKMKRDCNVTVTEVKRDCNGIDKIREEESRAVKTIADVAFATNKEEVSFTLKQCQDAAATIGMTPESIQAFFNHYDKQGWLLGNGRKIIKLSSALSSWKANNPSYGRRYNEPPKQEVKELTPEETARRARWARNHISPNSEVSPREKDDYCDANEKRLRGEC